MIATLVIDVGGTHTRIALAHAEATRARLDAPLIVATPRGRIHEAIQGFLAARPDLTIDGLAVAAAGRIRRAPGRSWVQLTNAALTIEREELQALLGVPRVWLVNDLAAIAAALPWLGEDALQAIGNARSATPGHRLVVGIGTGFGAAALTADGALLETEAGHANLAAVSASERHWLDNLAPLGGLAIEQVISGPGLLRLHQAITRQGLSTHEELRERWEKSDPGAVRTFIAFSTWLGRVIGDLVLSHGAWSGVVVAGGVIARLGPALDHAAFREGFEHRGAFASDLASVPVWLVRHPQPALLGLARLALL
ncbi:MAG: glucokinase [Nevskia sp.]